MVQVINCSLDEFIERAKRQKIIFFCAGRRLEEFCGRHHLADRILYVVDRDKRRKVVRIDGREIPILQAAEAGCEIRDSLLVISSLRYADEVIEQLDGLSQFDGCDLYISELFKPDIADFNFDLSRAKVIPKIIHYFWFGRKEMPEQYRRNIESWRRHCPDYQIVRWDESNYDVTKNRYMRQAFEAGKWGFVPDYARLDILNSYGGIYLDTDVELRRPLDDLLGYRLFCGFESNLENECYVNFGIGFGAKKDNRILSSMMEAYENVVFKSPDGSLNLVASPFYQTKVLERFGLKRNGRTQETEDFLALTAEYFAPVNLYGLGRATERSFSVHQYSATWFDEERAEHRRSCAEKYAFIKRHNFEGTI